jgi:hypothetical protein
MTYIGQPAAEASVLQSYAITHRSSHSILVADHGAKHETDSFLIAKKNVVITCILQI